MRLRVILVLALSLYPATGNATQESSKDDFFISLSGVGFPNINGASRDVRIEVAEGLKKRISALQNYVPAPTPGESQWLKNELDKAASLEGEIAINKYKSIYSSKEFLLAILESQFTQLMDVLDAILLSEIPPKQEALLWITLSYLLLDDQSAALHDVSVLGIVDFSSLQTLFEFGLTFRQESCWANYEVVGRNLLLSIVVPLLRDSTSDL